MRNLQCVRIGEFCGVKKRIRSKLLILSVYLCSSIIFLHCRERECKRRLRRQIERQEALADNPMFTRKFRRSLQFSPQHCCAGIHLMMEPADAYHCIGKEHIQYNMCIREMVDYVGCQREVRHVNGTRSVYSVHNELMAVVQAFQLDVRGEESAAQVSKTSRLQFKDDIFI